MSEPMTPLTPEAETIREAYAALNRHDVGGFIAAFDSQIVRVEFEGSPHEGTFRGIEAVREHVEKGRGTWAEGGCEPERFIVAGDRIIVAVHVRVRVKGEAAWREGYIGDVYTFRGGKVIEFRSFFEVEQALKWAGWTGPEAS
jgi:ketosteroid isomerase-like protein